MLLHYDRRVVSCSCVLSPRYLQRVPAQIARGANGWPALAALMAEEGDEGQLRILRPAQAERFLLGMFCCGICCQGPLAWSGSG